MRALENLGSFLLFVVLAVLSACSASMPSKNLNGAKKPANFYYEVDVSDSTENMNNPVVAKAVADRIAADARKMVQLGDTIHVYEAGARTAERMVAHPPFATDYNLRVPAAVTKLTEQMDAIAARYRREGGDTSTNLLLTLQSMKPECTPRSTVVLVTDALEESDAVSTTRALNANRPVLLPAPSSKFLAGCRVVLVGFGLTGDPESDKGQLLPETMLGNLRRGWLTYLQQAGVDPAQVEFVSLL